MRLPVLCDLHPPLDQTASDFERPVSAMTEYAHMNEIVPGLWVGDLLSTKDLQALRDNNIHSILTAMRGRIAINEVRIFTAWLARTSEAHLGPDIPAATNTTG